MSKVAIIMGSISDMPVMQEAIDILKGFDIETEVDIVSAHRTPEKLIDFSKNAHERGISVIIAGAGGAAGIEPIAMIVVFKGVKGPEGVKVLTLSSNPIAQALGELGTAAMDMARTGMHEMKKKGPGMKKKAEEKADEAKSKAEEKIDEAKSRM